MSVKHTVTLSRAEAEQKMLEMVFHERAYMFVHEPVGISNTDLAQMLEILNDSHNDGEGFENYWVEDDGGFTDKVIYALNTGKVG